MSFTDEDLRQLKQSPQGNEAFVWIPTIWFIALLSRLEAAEDVADVDSHEVNCRELLDEPEFCTCAVGVKKALWRRIAGK